MSLRDAMTRLADEAPAATVDDDLWARAARRRRLDRVAVVGATVGAIALLAGLLAWLPSTGGAHPADGDDLGVPDQLVAVPDHVVGRDPDSSLIGRTRFQERDLAVGRTAVAWPEGRGLATLVDAATGEYHLLRLPRFGSRDTGAALVLSPDGRQLAYTGGRTITVVDLETGTTHDIQLTIRLFEPELAWSPDARWLAWSNSYFPGATPLQVGRVRAEEAQAAPARLGRTDGIEEDYGTPAVAVTDDGELLVVMGSQVLRYDGTQVRTTPYERDHGFAATASLSDDGVLAVGDCCSRSMLFVDVETGVTTAVEVNVPSDLATITVNGWLDERTSVQQVMPQGGGGDGYLALVTPDGDVREVTSIEDSVPDGVTVATGLMTVGRPTVSRPLPDYPLSSGERVAVAFGTTGVLVALGLIVAAVVARRRRTAVVRPTAIQRTGLLLLGLVTGTAVTVAGAVVGVEVFGSYDEAGPPFLSGVGSVVVVGLALTLHRFWRWCGIGLVVAPPVTFTVGLFIIASAIGS